LSVDWVVPVGVQLLQSCHCVAFTVAREWILHGAESSSVAGG
jgi:hypothetical protein